MLFGAYQIDSNAQWSDGARPDYKNSLVFGNNDPDLGVIALKTTWYTLLGIKIVDYDISFKTDYTWGDAAINAIKMDLQNIATHETDTGQDFLTCTTPALEKRCMATPQMEKQETNT